MPRRGASLTLPPALAVGSVKDYLSKYSYAIKKTQEPKPDTSADAFVNSYDDFMKNTSV